MRFNLENISSTERRLDVYISSEEVEKKRVGIFGEIKKNANIKGFRPGKAPNKLIESMYKDTITSEMTNSLVQDSLYNALEEASVSPVNRPDIKPDKIQSNEEFHYSAEFEIIPEFELANYSGFDLKKQKVLVSEEDTDNALKRLRDSRVEGKALENEREAHKGDFVFVDFEGKLNGETIKDLKKENVQFLLGEGNLIPEFDENILGMNKGETKEFDVEYPGDFRIEEAAGKTVHYFLKLNDIMERELPDIDDQFAEGFGEESLKALKDKIKEDLIKQMGNRAEAKLREDIINRLVEKLDFDIPLSLTNDEGIRLERNFISSFESRGLPVPKIDQQIKDNLRTEAIKNVRTSVILGRIADKENIKVKDTEIEKRMLELSQATQLPLEQVRGIYQNKGLIESLEFSLLQSKVVDFIIKNSNVSEIEVKENNVDNT